MAKKKRVSSLGGDNNDNRDNDDLDNNGPWCRGVLPKDLVTAPKAAAVLVAVKARRQGGADRC